MRGLVKKAAQSSDRAATPFPCECHDRQNRCNCQKASRGVDLGNRMDSRVDRSCARTRTMQTISDLRQKRGGRRHKKRTGQNNARDGFFHLAPGKELHCQEDTISTGVRQEKNTNSPLQRPVVLTVPAIETMTSIDRICPLKPRSQGGRRGRFSGLRPLC